MQNSVTMNQISYNLDGILQDCWHRLINATHSPKHPFHTPCIATLSNGVPELRTVVLRKVIPSENTLIFYTDYRSPKVQQIAKNNVLSWLFYDPKSRLQYRIKTTATIHHNNEIAEQRWNESRLESRKCYLVNPAPATKIEIATDGLPEILKTNELTEDILRAGYEHFTVVENKVIEIDWLFLNHDGHRRAKFLLGKHSSEQYWVIP